MSRGSYFSLYRSYEGFKADRATMDAVKDEYYKSNRDGSFFPNRNPFTGKERTEKELSEHEKRLRDGVPLVMSLDFKAGSSENYCDRRPKTVEELSRKMFFNYVRRDDGTYLIPLLQWDFNSGFDCLINEYNMSPYDPGMASVEISLEDASKMLAAIEYLLGGKYDDDIEATMDTRFIKVFSEGNTSDSYWRYVDRHRYDKKKTEYEFRDPSGVSVKVTLPSSPSKGKNRKGSEDEAYFEREMSESNITQEFYMATAASALRAYLRSDDTMDGSKLVLIYTCWG